MTIFKGKKQDFKKLFLHADFKRLRKTVMIFMIFLNYN